MFFSGGKNFIDKSSRLIWNISLFFTSIFFLRSKYVKLPYINYLNKNGFRCNKISHFSTIILNKIIMPLRNWLSAVIFIHPPDMELEYCIDDILIDHVAILEHLNWLHDLPNNTPTLQYCSRHAEPRTTHCYHHDTQRGIGNWQESHKEESYSGVCRVRFWERRGLSIAWLLWPSMLAHVLCLVLASVVGMVSGWDVLVQ